MTGQLSISQSGNHHAFLRELLVPQGEKEETDILIPG